MPTLKFWIPAFAGMSILLTLILIAQQNQITTQLSTSNTPIDTFDQIQSLSENIPPAKLQTASVSFLAVGDISLSRGIAYAIDKNKDPLFPFQTISPLLKSTDFNFGNLETPFSSIDKYTPKSTLVFNAPKPNIQGLVENNFAVVSLANNHALDQNLEGVKTTREWLAKNNIIFTGTGESLDEAWMPAVVERNGIRVGFIAASYASINDGGKATNNYVARIEDIKNLQSAILNLKSQIDFLVVSMHAGTEYVREPNQSQIDFSRAAIDAGADMVIGHHPHWVQNKEIYCPNEKTSREILFSEILELTFEEISLGCKPIYYSLGNFVFDQSWSRETTEGLTLKLTLKKTGGCIGSAPTMTSPNPSSRGGGSVCHPQLQGSQSTTTLESIQEIPIKIESNCCPVVANEVN